MNRDLGFLNVITLLSFIVGIYALAIAIQNLEENRQQTSDTQEVLDKLNKHLKEQDKYLRKEI